MQARLISTRATHCYGKKSKLGHMKLFMVFLNLLRQSYEVRETQWFITTNRMSLQNAFRLKSITVCSARLLWAWIRYNMNWDPPGSNHKAKPISNYQLSLLNTNPVVLRINRPANASLRYAIFIRNASRLKSTGISILKEQTHIQWHPVTDLPGSMWQPLFFLEQ